MSKRNYTQIVDDTTRSLQDMFLSISGAVGLVVAALPPALMFGFASQHALVGAIGYAGSIAVAIALAAALETAGVKVSHNALSAFADWRRGDEKSKTDFYWLAALTMFYLAAGATAIFFFDDNPQIRLAGFLSYAVAGIMYIGSGFEFIRHEARQGIVARLQEEASKLQEETIALQETANQLQESARLAQQKTQQLQAELAEAQSQATEWQDKAHDLQAKLIKAQRQVTTLQSDNEAMQEAWSAWQHMNTNARTFAKLNAGLLEENEALQLVDIKDVRTLRKHASALNGV